MISQEYLFRFLFRKKETTKNNSLFFIRKREIQNNDMLGF